MDSGFEDDIGLPEQECDSRTVSTSNTYNASPAPRTDSSDYCVRRPRRSHSARSSLKSPMSPKTQKAVHFADALGLELTQVRHILDSTKPPSIPPSATMHLNCSFEYSSLSSRATRTGKVLSPCFFLGSKVHQLKKLLVSCVVLESTSVTDNVLNGVIKVLNIAYDKEVFVRYTLNDWTSYYDIRANYIADSSDGISDKFSFSLFLPDLAISSKVHFAIRYFVQGCEFWDNNQCRNYTYECGGPEFSCPTERGWLTFV